MKSMFMNYFKDKKLYQWDEEKEIFIISETNIEEEFCLDKTNMDIFCRFNKPKIKKGKTLELEENKVKASLKLSEANLTIPNLEFTDEIIIDVEKLKKAVNFVSKNNIKPALTGVHIGEKSVVATDSFYAYKTEHLGVKKPITIISSFIKLLSKISGEVNLKFNENIVTCEHENIMYVGRLLIDPYPNLEIIYKEKENTITYRKTDLKELLSLGKSNYVIFDENKVIVSDVANTKEYLFEKEIENTINETIGINYERLLNVLNSLEEEKVIVNYDTGLKPILINEEYIICPMKVGN